MQRFADLYNAIDATTSIRAKLEALTAYFRAAEPADAAWAVYFLSGGKPRQIVPSRVLRRLAAALAGIPDWLFDESYHAVGDLAETMAHILPEPTRQSALPLSVWVEARLLPLRGLPDAELRERLTTYWSELGRSERFVWNKLITGSFRVGVSRQLVIRALAQTAGVDPRRVAQRLMATWQPSANAYRTLLNADAVRADVGQPYPFFLAHPLEVDVQSLGDVRDWQAEWKWDGLRAQLLKRAGLVFVWSRGEELITDWFPEIAQSAAQLDDGTVLDGEVVAWQADGPMPFASLQRRIGRKRPSTRIGVETPVRFLAYDLLEAHGQDLRERPLVERRTRLQELLASAPNPLHIAPIVLANSWEGLAQLREESRARGVEGLMLKRCGSPYRVGRVRGDWWKWKIEPYSIDAVLVYAQRGHGRRASLYTDYTFAVWSAGELVPFTKAYSGLTDAEIQQVDAFIRRNTQEKFGPVRSVKPELVCEIGFEAIQASSRHKAGIAVRFPRILRLRNDKKIDQADTLERLHRLLKNDLG
jgi:DNA ligase 1